MSSKAPVITHLGHVYRVAPEAPRHPTLYTIETLQDDEWVPTLEHVSANYIAEQLVKHAAVENTDQAFDLLAGV